MSNVNRFKFLSLSLLMAMLLGGPALAQTDPSGEWENRFHEDEPERVPGPEIGDYLGLPINEAARLRGDTWVATLLELPENQCRPHPSDYAWRGPALLRIWKEVDPQTQKLVAYHTHISWQSPEQTIYMDGRPHPPPYAPHTWQGFSTGVWQGDILTVTTDHLKEGWIRRNGIPRSANAVVTTYLLRHDDYLTVAVLISDPAYLTEPFIRTTDFVSAPQQQLAPYPCEVVDEIDRPLGLVPNHLPGTNPFLDEFPAEYGIPPDAARGGAETMYPEYQVKLKTMKTLPRPAGKHSDR
jgi:hypothetical protein